MKYDLQLAVKAHEQLLALVARHDFFQSPAKSPTVFKTLSNIYGTQTSSKELNEAMRTMFSQLGEAKLEELAAGFSDKDKKQVFKILKASTGKAKLKSAKEVEMQ